MLTSEEDDEGGYVVIPSYVPATMMLTTVIGLGTVLTALAWLALVLAR